ncbi:Alpha/Beta hydrolase protein [Massariosphaeria phaeospora]|uniref:Alpha/Beta hydrolase protein n=1 Tax=Massariosphaeria phaeospora TaxID=100035 RepID=A0A7C8ID85_9PLEO|nr:Alpha/Beta hydrolase protein [Massariosphaeria phaeospora]
MKTIITFAILNAATAYAGCMTTEQCPDLLALETPDCHQYHIFVTRGSDSPYPGHQSDLVRLVCDGLGGDCGFENIIYPANSSYAGREAWCQSAASGAVAAQAQLTEYTDRCPSSKLILFGFSQGASVTLDYLGGGGGPVGKCIQDNNPPLDRLKAPGSNVVAAIVFGAAVRAASMPYSFKGGKDFNGTSPRSEKALAGLEPYADILRDYCNFGDPVCAPSSQPAKVAQHLNYFDLYNDEAAEWVIDTAQGPSGNNTNTKSSTSLSSMPSTASGGPARATSIASSLQTTTSSTIPKSSSSGSSTAAIASSTIASLAIMLQCIYMY